MSSPAITLVLPRRRRAFFRAGWGKQLMLQALLIFISFTVLFPLLWVVSMSLDPRNISRPTELTLIPPGASLQAYQDVIAQPTSNPVSLPQLAFNSFGLAAGVSLGSLGLGVLAAYAFSRFHFPARRALMIAIVAVLMVPSVAALAPLFVFLNKIQISSGDFSFNLRNSLLGVGLALTSGALPFAIWNLKGYIDTIPKELEEAASLDGASRRRRFSGSCCRSQRPPSRSRRSSASSRDGPSSS
jgi:arabinogalactan oligomer/maltooligosaccharide transport system permease protein